MPRRSTEPQPPPETRTVAFLQPVVAVAALAGLLTSVRLWLSSHRLFPLTPIWQGLPQPPYPFDYVLFALMLAVLIAIAVVRRPARFIPGFLILTVVMIVLDQSRWQPWLTEYAVLLGALLVQTPRQTAGVLHPCRLYLMCMYFYSGLQKLGYAFVLVLAGMVAPMFAWLHLDPKWLTPGRLIPIALLLGLVECISGVLLAFQRTRKAAVVCLILTHLSLLLWLGPLVLGWNQATWPWNVAQIVLLLVLFWGRSRWNYQDVWRSHPYARGVGLVCAVLPLFTLLGVTDSYLGFSLYSGNIKDAVVYVDPKRIADLPEAIRRYVKADGIMDIDGWSRDELGVPIYPETRVFQSAGRQVAILLGSGAVVRVLELQKPDRLTGKRETKTFDPLTY